MAPNDLRRRAFKRPAISDQAKRRELSLQRQAQQRRDAQLQARCLASSVMSLQAPSPEPTPDMAEEESGVGMSQGEEELKRELDVSRASRMKGPEARRWFAKQVMLPEWMIDVPDRLNHDWYVFARPAGKRCFVVSSKGTTVSRLRNGSVLHHFPSALPNGSRKRTVPDSADSYSVLDCIFHELDQAYYIIDMVCWRGYSYYDCTAEFRFFWLSSKLAETGACEQPSAHHKYRFNQVPVFNCDERGLQMAYSGAAPYVKDGLMFYNKHALYHPGNTPLVLVWKDETCSQYVIDTDNNGHVPIRKQVVLELQDDGKVTTSDDPPVVFGCLDGEFVQKSGLQSGSLLRFSLRDGGLNIVDGKLEKVELEYLGKSNRSRAFADSYSKVMFQFMSRNSPLQIRDLLASTYPTSDQESGAAEVEMVG